MWRRSSTCAAGYVPGSVRTRKWSERTRRFFEDEDDDQAIVSLYHERAGILDGDPEGDVDLASHAYQIWKNAIGADPSLEKAVSDLPDVVFSSRKHAPIAQRPEGVLVFMRTSDANDALAYVDREGNSITESQLEILSAAECRPRHAGTTSPREPS